MMLLKVLIYKASIFNLKPLVFLCIQSILGSESTLDNFTLSSTPTQQRQSRKDIVESGALSCITDEDLYYTYRIDNDSVIKMFPRFIANRCFGWPQVVPTFLLPLIAKAIVLLIAFFGFNIVSLNLILNKNIYMS